MASKIERLGLARRIEELISEGVQSSPAIAEALNREGFKVSQPTVSRWLKEVRDTRAEATQQIIQDHIQKVVPADLEAVERMEAVCLEWAHEENPSFAHRIAAQRIQANLPDWLANIRRIAPEGFISKEDYQKALSSVVEAIMSDCILWIADDFNIQKKRLAAMRQATQIIELKLRYSGALGESDAGNIFFVGKEDRVEQDPNSGKVYVYRGGK